MIGHEELAKSGEQRRSPTQLMLATPLLDLLHETAVERAKMNDIFAAVQSVMRGEGAQTFDRSMNALIVSLQDDPQLRTVTIGDFLGVFTNPEAVTADSGEPSESAPRDRQLRQLISLLNDDQTRQLFAGIQERVRADISAGEVRQRQALEQLLAKAKELLAKAKEESGHDFLTNLLNRRGLMHWYARAQTEQGEFALSSRFLLMQFDIDKFKDINDTYGHPKGDDVLKIVGDLLRQHFREGDALVRYGGEEFWVVLELKPGEDARELAHRRFDEVNTDFRLRVIALGIDNGATLSCGAQIGRWDTDAAALAWLATQSEAPERPTIQHITQLQTIFLDQVAVRTDGLRGGRVGSDESLETIAQGIMHLRTLILAAGGLGAEQFQKINELYLWCLVNVFTKLFNIYSSEGDRALYVAKGKTGVGGADAPGSRNQIRFGPSMGLSPD